METGLGGDVVPLILADLRQEPYLWFRALRAITGEDPVPAASQGKVRQMAEAWIQWGKQKGLLWRVAVESNGNSSRGFAALRF
jgi:hypothetical protein